MRFAALGLTTLDGLGRRARYHHMVTRGLPQSWKWGFDVVRLAHYVARRCYDLAVETVRKQFLAERLPGETVEH